MFGYRLLGFGSGGAADPEADYLVVAGGGGGQTGGGGAGGYRTSFPGGTKMVLEKGTSFPVTVVQPVEDVVVHHLINHGTQIHLGVK